MLAMEDGFDEDARPPKEQEPHRRPRLSQNEHGNNVEAFPVYVRAIHLEKNLQSTSQLTETWPAAGARQRDSDGTRHGVSAFKSRAPARVCKQSQSPQRDAVVNDAKEFLHV